MIMKKPYNDKVLLLLGALPKTFQDGATKLLHNHLRNTGNGTQVFFHLFYFFWSLFNVMDG